MGPSASPIGTLAAARTSTSLNNRLISPQFGSWRASPMTAGARWENPTTDGP
jgi:hypothetical protein